MPGRIWEQAMEVAMDQNGFITFADLRRLSADPVRLRQWHQHGKIDKVGHGIYRFRQIAPTPLDSYMLATLWPSGRGVLSHDSALELHDLCDINPAKVHLTLPPGYWPRRRGGELYMIHHEALQQEEVTWHEGIRIVTPAVAIRQALDTDVPTHLIRQAIDTARRQGRVSRPLLDPLAERLTRRS